MSATVTHVATDRWMGVFYSGTKFDFGADVSRALMVHEMCEQHWDESGAFFGDDGAYCFMTGREVWERLAERTWTFGEFGGMFEVGSGHMTDWLGL
jgi:hypothetical protein